VSDDVHSPTNAGPDPADKGPTFEVEGDKGPTFEPPVAGSEAPAGAGMLGTGPQPGPSAAGTLEDRVAESIDRLTDVLGQAGTPLLHTQDCISARAATRVRDTGTGPAGVRVLRTVHHVDDFSSQVLMDCQRQAILEPDVVLTVSEVWRQQLAVDYGVSAQVVPNGVDVERFSTVSPAAADAMRMYRDLLADAPDRLAPAVSITAVAAMRIFLMGFS